MLQQDRQKIQRKRFLLEAIHSKGVRRKMKKHDGIGFVLLMVGGCAIGSATVIPAVMVITGLAILAISARKENRR